MPSQASKKRAAALRLLRNISVPFTAGQIRRKTVELSTVGRYREAMHMGLKLKLSLEGDFAYFEPATNFVALQERITGWIIAQPYFEQFARELLKHYPRDTPEHHATDMAIQIASDITIGNAKFSPE